MDSKIESLMHQLAAVPSHYGSVMVPNAILHHAIDFVCNFIGPQINFIFGVCTALLPARCRQV